LKQNALLTRTRISALLFVANGASTGMASGPTPESALTAWGVQRPPFRRGIFAFDKPQQAGQSPASDGSDGLLSFGRLVWPTTNVAQPTAQRFAFVRRLARGGKENRDKSEEGAGGADCNPDYRFDFASGAHGVWRLSSLKKKVRRGKNNRIRDYRERHKHKPWPAVAWTGLLDILIARTIS